jgi:hypothetical protein
LVTGDSRSGLPTPGKVDIDVVIDISSPFGSNSIATDRTPPITDAYRVIGASEDGNSVAGTGPIV